MIEPIAKSREGTWLWLAKIIAGALIVFLLALHFIVNHLVAPGGLLTYIDVVRYYSYPIIPVIEGIFLVVVVCHAFIGLRSIILDLNPSDKALQVINWILILVGVAAISFGIWLIIVVASQGSIL